MFRRKRSRLRSAASRNPVRAERPILPIRPIVPPRAPLIYGLSCITDDGYWVPATEAGQVPASGATAMKPAVRRLRKVKFLVAALIGTAPVLNGCFDTDAFKRFREAYGPGFVEGLSMAVENPAQSQLGFRRLAQALFEGVGAVIDPRSPSSAGSD